jgi:AcrR family transcriptional regulator
LSTVIARTTARSGAKGELSRPAIVDRALDIADAEGRDAITIRRLAQEFGVTPMALYWHVANKDELLDAMGDRFFETVPDDVIEQVPNLPWPDYLGQMVQALVATLRVHPASAHLAAPRLLQCERGRLIAERTLARLRTEGFSVEQATDIGRTAMQTAVTLVTEQAGAEPGVPAAQRDAVREAKRQAIEALPADEFPNLRACAAAMTDCEDEQAYFDFGIDLLVMGVQQLRRRVRAQSRA